MALPRKRREQIAEASDGAFFNPEEKKRHSDQLKLRYALGRLLSDQPWEYFVTLTSKREWSPDTWGSLLRRWPRWLEQRTNGKVWCFWVLEKGAADRLHAHALVRGESRSLPFNIWYAWPGGFDGYRSYDPDQGGAWYLVKDIPERALDWGFFRDDGVPNETLERLDQLRCA